MRIHAAASVAVVEINGAVAFLRMRVSYDPGLLTTSPKVIVTNARGIECIKVPVRIKWKYVERMKSFKK